MVEFPERTAAAAGVAGPAALLATFAVTGVASPSYAWPTEPFSVIGAAGGPTATAFNAGLAVGGLALLPFAWRLWRSIHRLAGGLYAVVGASFAGAGLFPAGDGAVAHELFGSLAFFGVPLVLWTAGVAEWRTGNRRAGAVGFALGTVALAVWLPYDLGLAAAQVGYGAAEAVSLVALAAWSAWTALRLRHRDADGGGEPAGERRRTGVES